MLGCVDYFVLREHPSKKERNKIRQPLEIIYSSCNTPKDEIPYNVELPFKYGPTKDNMNNNAFVVDYELKDKDIVVIISNGVSN